MGQLHSTVKVENAYEFYFNHRLLVAYPHLQRRKLSKYFSEWMWVVWPPLHYFLYRTESVIRLDPSRQFHTFCDHTETLWFNPITCWAQREIRGLCRTSSQAESLAPFGVTHLVILDAAADAGVYCAALKIKNISITGLPMRGWGDTDDGWRSGGWRDSEMGESTIFLVTVVHMNFKWVYT